MAARLACLVLIGAVYGIHPHAALAQSPDPLEGLNVSEIRVSGLRHVPADSVERHLVTRAGQPFHRADLQTDMRRLDELRLFASVLIDPRLENDGVVVQVTVTETLRLLPVVVLRVTDENGLSAGPGLRGINLLGRGSQLGVAARFGGETGAIASLDTTTISPDTWTKHLGFSYTTRENVLYGFEESATSADARFGRNWNRGLRTGATADFLAIGSEDDEDPSTDSTDVIPTLGAFLTLDTLDSATNPRRGTWAELEMNRRMGDAESWTFILDGRRFQPLSARHGLGLFSLATFQTGEVGDGLPDYLQFDLGGANSVRGWSLGSRRGRHQWINSLEYTYVALPIRPFSVAGLNLYAGMQAVGFADAGWAWGSGDDADRPAIDGYGVGLRFLVPFVDVIRLDLAWGEPGRGATGYFGVSLKAARQRQRVR